MFKLRFLLTLFVVLGLAACSTEGNPKNILDDTDQGSTDGGGPPDQGDVPVGEVEKTGFWVTVTSTEFLTYVTQASETTDAGLMGTKCYIDKSDPPSSKVMKCYVDILESDLFMNTVELQYNSPPGLCEYVSVLPSWHWNYSAGRGPRAVSYTVEEKEAGIIVSNCNSVDESGASVPCENNPELYALGDPEGPKCIYDKNGPPPERGINCCFGSYSKTVTTRVETEDGVETSVNTTEEDWGGNIKACLGGAGITSWSKHSTLGYPVRAIYPVDSKKGLNQSIKMPANGSSTVSYFSTEANFFTSISSQPHSHDGYVNSRSTTEPYAFDPIDDLDGSPLEKGEPYFTFRCLDDAFEVKHKVQVSIREWNTLTEYLAYGTSNGSSYDPDVTGGEGTNCSSTSFPGEICNDRVDFDDIINALGTYDTPANLNLRSNTVRKNYFPRVYY